MLISGFAASTGLEILFLEIDRSIQAHGMVTTGTYTMSGTTANTYDLYAEYIEPSGAEWIASDGSAPPISMDPFTITISTLTSTRVTGTFSGTVRNLSSVGPLTKSIKNGSFSVPVQ